MGATVIQTLTAVSYSLTLNSLPALASEGSTVGFSGKLTANGSGVPGATIRIDYSSGTNISGTVGTTATDGNGNFSLDWKIPYGFGCRTYVFRAVDVASGTTSNGQTMSVGINTKIVLSLPQTVTVNKPFTVSGTLLWQYDANTWNPLAGKQVSISVDGSVVAQPTTDANGNFSATITITTAGSHSIMAQFAGTS